ncbi:MAG: hypothetical protein ACRENP_09605 [Longimicrobiales bacterium]
MKKTARWWICLLVVGACGSGDGQTNTDPLTQRQRDSIVGASKLPGARAVQSAIRASDAAAARASALDSINR